jgi:hypothetical protein
MQVLHFCCLNLVLYGFFVNFESALNVRRQDAVNLFERLDGGRDDRLSSEDARF